MFFPGKTSDQVDCGKKLNWPFLYRKSILFAPELIKQSEMFRIVMNNGNHDFWEIPLINLLISVFMYDTSYIAQFAHLQIAHNWFETDVSQCLSEKLNQMIHTGKKMKTKEYGSTSFMLFLLNVRYCSNVTFFYTIR